MRLMTARLRALREDKELTPGQLAYKAHISRDYVYLLEKAQRPNVSGTIMAQIARALECSVDYLYGLTDDPRPLPVAQAPESRALAGQMGGLLADPNMEGIIRLLLEHPEKRAQVYSYTYFLVEHDPLSNLTNPEA